MFSIRSLALSALTLFTIIPAAHAQLNLDSGCCDRVVTLAICHDTRDIKDEGLSVIIHSGGFTGLTSAAISHDTIAGAMPMGNVPVSRVEDEKDHAGLILYTGDKFRLVINENMKG